MPLFEAKKNAPLADRIRPRTIDEFIGQDNLIGPDTPLRKSIEKKEIQSMIFWVRPAQEKPLLPRLSEKQVITGF